MKRGILTISIMLLCGALLLLLSGIAFHESMMKYEAAKLAEIEDARQEYDAAAYSIRALASAGAANASISGNNISFSCNTSALTNYRRDLERLASFLEGKAGVSMNINTSEAKRPLLHIWPHNITIDVWGSALSFTPQNSPSSSNDISAYHIKIAMNHTVPSFNWTNVSSAAPGSANSTYISIIVDGTNGSLSTSQTLQKYQYSELRLLDAANRSLATVQFYSPSALRIYYDQFYTQHILASVHLNRTPDSVDLGATLINVSGEVSLIGQVIYR